MVCNQADRHVFFFIFFISNMRILTHLIPQSLYRVHIKDGIHILHNDCQTLQTHSGINILLLKFGIISVPIIIKLGKYVIPNLHIAVAFTAYCTIRAAASVFLPSVIINFRTRSAGPRTMLPEVITLTKSENTLRRNPYFFIPNLKRFLVFFINGWVQSVRIQSNHFRQEFPCPANRLCLKIIPKGEVPQHLEKCAVARCLSYIFNIACTDTFLTGSHSPARRNLRPGKIWL